MGVDPEDLEHTAYQVGSEWRLPCCGSGDAVKGIAEALAPSDGFANPAHFPAEAEVLIRSTKLVSVQQENSEHTNCEGDDHDPERRVANAAPDRRKAVVGTDGLSCCHQNHVFWHADARLSGWRISLAAIIHL